MIYSNSILHFSVISRTSEAGAQRCQKVLQPTNCTLQQCGSDCFNMFKNSQPFGQCIRDNINNTYACVCVYNCNATPHLV